MMVDFVAVVVLYKTQVEQCVTLITLHKALQTQGIMLDVVVYDNSPQVNIGWQNTFENYNITYKADTQNSGVSAAYNYGHSIAAANQKKWILLFDQDTQIPENAVGAYIDAIKEYPQEYLFAPVMLTGGNEIISPGNFKFMRGSYAGSFTYGLNYFKGHSLINSGLCISVAAFAKNGGYNERIKLDYSDHDFIHRFSKRVSSTYVLIKLKIFHQLSTDLKSSVESDKVRFNYYLEGAKHFSVSFHNRAFLKIVTLLRSAKLSMHHKNAYFIKKYLINLFA